MKFLQPFISEIKILYRQFGRVETSFHFDNRFYSLVAETGNIYIYNSLNNQLLKTLSIED